MKWIKCISCYFPPLLVCLGMAVAIGASAGEEAPAGSVFALVNGKSIAVQEYSALYSATLRNRYYHGAPPEAEADAVRKEVADLLVERALLIEEAERRGIQPDAAKIEQAVAAADARYGAAQGWKQQRGQVLPEIKGRAAQQSLLDQLEKTVRAVPPADPAEVRAYYEQKAALFTEPEKLRLSVILIRVDPGASGGEWGKAREEMQGIYLRIKGGASFAELARQYSADPSAGNGGDLGYLHGGMLPDKIQEKVDTFHVGDVSEPVTTLEGVAIFHIVDREVAKLREFADVEPRARELLQRDRAEQAWRGTIDRLRAAATIEILTPPGGNAGGSR